MTSPRTLLLLWLLSFAAPASGQVAPYPYEVGTQDAVLAPLGLGLSLWSHHLSGHNAPLTLDEIRSLTPTRVNGFDRTAARSWSTGWATGSDWGRNVLVGGAIALSFASPVADGRWDDATATGAIFAESYLLLAGLTYVTKELTGRKRPYLYNDALAPEERLALANADDQGAQLSFYSGHAAAAFMAATLMSTVYRDVHGPTATSDALWASSLTVAAATALARVKAGKHFPTDVITGSVVGTAVGYLVPRLHRRKTGGAQPGPSPALGLTFRIPLGGGFPGS